MEYKVIVSRYTGSQLKKSYAGWSQELKNLSNELTNWAKNGWIVKEIVPTLTGSDIVYTVLLEKQ
jgi:hypothetical protein